MRTSYNNQAFSLVELSIVLVILGLLTGGILAGQSLIRASELRAVTAEAQRYFAATNTFRDKYFAIPGDFNSATRFWSRLNNNADCVTNSATVVATPGSCDGNGDGSIANNGVLGGSGEMHQFWRQLSLAGLIEGDYTGLAGSTAGWTGGDIFIGVNAPRSKLNNAGWSANTNINNGGGATFYVHNYGQVLSFGARSVGTITQAPVLKPEEAWNIDTKMDDGKPGRGKIFAAYWDICTNSANDTDYAGDYLLTDNSVQCSLRFLNGF